MNSYINLNRMRSIPFTVAITIAISSILSACSGGSSGSDPITPIDLSPAISANVVPVSVNSGGDFNSSNSLYVSVTLCSPTDKNICTTIDRVLVDTGSIGLRIFAQPRATQALASLNLTQQQDVSGNPIAECLPFVSGSTWGPIKYANLTIGQKTANNVAIQVIADPKFTSVPRTCSTRPSEMVNDPAKIFANGILGIGLFPQDCGTNCTTSSTKMNVYYSCSAKGDNCVNTAQPLDKQIQNPIGVFNSDNNGFILALDPVPATGATSINGTLTFGIDTESNNISKNTNTILINNDPTSPTYGYFTTSFNGTSYRYSFIDSGSNGYFFNAPLAGCASPNSGYYCPSSTLALNATMTGATGSSAPANVNFNIANINTTYNIAFDAIAGDTYLNTIFDWGLPFFFGKSVYFVQAGKNTSKGNGPYVGF